MNRTTNRSCQQYQYNVDLMGDVERKLNLVYPLLVVISVTGNAANLLVYRHKFLRSSTTIRLLSAKSVANIVSLVSLFPNFVKSVPALTNQPDVNSFYWTGLPYMMFGANAFATSAIWLTMVMSLEAYALIAFPVRVKSWCTMRHANYVIGLTFSCAICLQVIFFASRRIHVTQCYDLNLRQNVAAYLFVTRKKSLRHLEDVYFYAFSSSTIVCPMLIMLYTTVAINYHLFWTSHSFASSAVEQKRCVMRLSLVTTVSHVLFELPHFAVFIMAAIVSPSHDFWQHNEYLSALANFLSLLNSALPFFVYVTCSRRFRRIARCVFCGESVQKEHVSMADKSTKLSGTRGSRSSHQQRRAAAADKVNAQLLTPGWRRSSMSTSTAPANLADLDSTDGTAGCFSKKWAKKEPSNKKNIQVTIVDRKCGKETQVEVNIVPATPSLDEQVEQQLCAFTNTPSPNESELPRTVTPVDGQAECAL